MSATVDVPLTPCATRLRPCLHRCASCGVLLVHCRRTDAGARMCCGGDCRACAQVRETTEDAQAVRWHALLDAAGEEGRDGE